MGARVVKVCAHHVLTPLGEGSHENYRQICAGHSGVSLQHAQDWGVAEDFYASIFPEELIPQEPEGATRAERLALHSIRQTLSGVDLKNSRVQLFLATTKGNVELLDETDDVLLGSMAQKLSDQMGFSESAVVVSNACTSGVCALVSAHRALLAGHIDYAVVCGVEVQSRFIISGFQCLHAMSDAPCMPFSMNRIGLNAGEAVATLLLTTTEEAGPEDWVLLNGAIRNDAFHISAPSKKGVGSLGAIQSTLADFAPSHLAFINVHGTATMFNDEMESVALQSAGLSSVLINSLKGYFGHTMGAAGVLESILSMESVEGHLLPATQGYDGELGVSRPVRISAENQPIQGNAFLKLISGFGGCNAAVLFAKGGAQ